MRYYPYRVDAHKSISPKRVLKKHSSMCVLLSFNAFIAEATFAMSWLFRVQILLTAWSGLFRLTLHLIVGAYCQTSNIRRTKFQNLDVIVLSCSCLCPIHWNQVLSREWRCSWSSTDRRCSNYIEVILTILSPTAVRLILKIWWYLQMIINDIAFLEE